MAQELKDMGFKSIGADLSISKKASFYGVENISIGSHVRIDDFCILSGKISIGDYIHIAAYSALFLAIPFLRYLLIRSLPPIWGSCTALFRREHDKSDDSG